MAMGLTRADGRSLLKWDRGQEPADDLPSFTLGSVNVSPMSMAAAYATVAARGVYCKPVAVAKIISPGGAKLPVESAGCHQAIPAGVADAASYILQGVLTSGTAAGRGIGRPAAGKTGTSDNFDFAAFGGYTPDLAGYVSVFNPIDPVKFPMEGTGVMLPDRLRGPDVRRGRARVHLADDVRACGAGQPATQLRPGGHQPGAVVDGQRADQPGAEEARRRGQGWRQWRRERRRPRERPAVAAAPAAARRATSQPLVR